MSTIHDEMNLAKQFVWPFPEAKSTEDETSLLSFLVLAVIRENTQITANQILSLLRNVYSIPEEETKKAINLLNVVNATRPTESLLFRTRVVATDTGSTTSYMRAAGISADNNWQDRCASYTEDYGLPFHKFKAAIYRRPKRKNKVTP